MNDIKKRGRTTHGMHKSPENVIWRSMKDRCSNQNHFSYSSYGGRGISVCDRWLHSFENFFTDMGRRPSKKHSLDRLDNDKNYTPENCKWSTRKEQDRNRSDNVWVEHNGERLIMADLARKLEICPKRFWHHYTKKKRSVDFIINFYKKA